MADLHETATVELRVNDKQAAAKMDNLQKKVDNLNYQIEKAHRNNDLEGEKRYRKELAKTEAEMRKIQSTSQQINHALNNLSTAKPKELQRVIKAINDEINSGRIVRGSKEWDIYNAKLREAKTELEHIRAEQKAVTEINNEGFFGNVFDSASRVWGFYTIATDLYDRINNSLNQRVKAYAQMEEAEAQVRKYTGMTTEQVKELNEELKKIDIRTAREELNALAGDAGRLGITEKDMVFEFVEGADKIRVALGDDLGESAVRDIGKLAEVFGESDRLGLRGAMLATGSAVNELAQNSSAGAGYIVDFTARLAGVGQQAGISQADIMGYASALDQNMQQLETSSTVLSQLITKMFQQPARFANLAGMEVKEFSELISRDANAALLRFLETMRSKGGFDSMAPMFEEMKLNGTRAVGVLSSLATHVDQIKAAQLLANDAYQKGTSVIEEFNVQNGTVQAKLDKAKKEANEIAVALGERLYPLLIEGLNATNRISKVLITLIDFTAKHTAALITLTTVITAYMVKAKAMAALDAATAAGRKTLAIATAAYTSATWALNAALAGDTLALDNLAKSLTKANAITKIVTASTALLRGVWALLKLDIAGATAAFRIFNTVIAANPIMALVTVLGTLTLGFVALNRRMNEQYKLQSALDRISEKSNKEYEKRKDSIEGLKELMPEYAAQLEREGALYAGNTEALKRYNEALQAHTRYEATRDEYNEALKQLQDLEKFSNVKQTGPAAFFINKQTATNIENARAKVEALRESMNQYWFDYRKASGGQGNTWEPAANPITTTPTTPDTEKEDNDSQKKRLEAIEAAAIREQTVIKAMYAKGEIDYREYTLMIIDLERQLLVSKMELYDSDSKEYAQLLSQRLDQEQKYSSQQLQYTKSDLEEESRMKLAALQDDYLKGRLTKEAYQQARFQEEIRALQAQQRLYTESSQEYADIERQIEEKLASDKLSRYENYQQQLKSVRERYQTMTAADTMAKEIASLDELHAMGLLKEEEYQQMLASIRKQYQEQQGQQRMQAVQTLYSSMEAVASSYSQFVNAQQQAEVTALERKYDTEIQAAGRNTAKAKRLEEKKQKDVAAVKNKYNRRAMAIEVAQALASTAMAAINAYASAAKVAFWLGPIAAAAATAAGMFQVAAIQKQHESQSEGYYSGGFTDRGDVREEAGVVHKGEFVANHEAVGNPDISPVLRLIDYAQRHNAVAQLTTADIARAIGQPVNGSSSAEGGMADIAALVAVQTGRQTDVLDRLQRTLDEGIEAYTTIEGEHGFENTYRKYQQLKKNT